MSSSKRPYGVGLLIAGIDVMKNQKRFIQNINSI
jgi:20S proteasome alpha/beta subunit